MQTGSVLPDDCWRVVLNACTPFSRYCLALTCRQLALHYNNEYCAVDDTIFTEYTVDETRVRKSALSSECDAKDLLPKSVTALEDLLKERLAERQGLIRSQEQRYSQNQVFLECAVHLPKTGDGKVPCTFPLLESPRSFPQAWDDNWSRSNFTALHPIPAIPTNRKDPYWGEAGRSQPIGAMFARGKLTACQVNPSRIGLRGGGDSFDFTSGDRSHKRRLSLLDDYWRDKIKSPLIYKSFIVKSTESYVTFRGKHKGAYKYRPLESFKVPDDLTAQYHNPVGAEEEPVRLQEWLISTHLEGLEFSIVPEINCSRYDPSYREIFGGDA